jgi:hypothetical protein
VQTLILILRVARRIVLWGVLIFNRLVRDAQPGALRME